MPYGALTSGEHANQNRDVGDAIPYSARVKTNVQFVGFGIYDEPLVCIDQMGVKPSLPQSRLCRDSSLVRGSLFAFCPNISGNLKPSLCKGGKNFLL